MTEPSYKYILVAGGYGMSRFLDFSDKKTANLFADGAGAVVLGVGEEPGFHWQQFFSGRRVSRCTRHLHRWRVPPCTPENLNKFWCPQG